MQIIRITALESALILQDFFNLIWCVGDYLPRLRFKPSSLARLMALWAKIRLNSGWVIVAMSLAVRLRISSRGAKSGSLVGCAWAL